MRLDKFLADMGVGSRSDLKKAIRKSLVTVNGAVEKDPGAQVSAEDHICFDGAEIRYAEQQYYMLHKPAGVLSASEDRRQTTVVDLINLNDELVRKDLFPVGRLDKDTEGLLIITNDGPLAHQLLVPKHHIDKTYYAIVTGTITEDDQRAFTRGIRYDEKLTALPATLRVLSTGKTVADLRRELGFTATSERLLRTRLAGPAFIGAEEPADITEDSLVSEVEITIQEGKFHQIKKMVKALPDGKEILYLRRITMGALRLDPNLAPGEFRKLRQDEIKILKDSVE